MDVLSTALQHLGYAERPQQRRLYEALLANDELVAQAGTGVGKSIAILSAAFQRSIIEKPSLVVVPTNVLMDQYALKDGPAFAEATGAVVRTLKGRGNYLCPYGSGWMGPDVSDDLKARLASLDVQEVGPDEADFGCPGSRICKGAKDSSHCHYVHARDLLAGADVIITNANLLVIESSFIQMRKAAAEAALLEEDDGDDDQPAGEGPRIFPDFGMVFVDEAHTLEAVVRESVGVTIGLRTVVSMEEAGEGMAAYLRQWRGEDPVRTYPNAALAQALHGLRRWKIPENPQGHKRRIEVKEAAEKLYTLGSNGAFTNSAAVMWVEPGERAVLKAMPVSVALTAGSMLTNGPFALVSATVPSTMAGSLGVAHAPFLDVGHPFDYRRQAALAISGYAGTYTAAQTNTGTRADELCERILAHGGGALALFTSYRDLDAVHRRLAPRLRKAGLTVLRQERDSMKRELGERFKADGNAVLFATRSFATGFDAPGDALRFVAIWKLPFPGQSPLVSAIRDRSWAAYEDMMLVEMTQAAGRLIRTDQDQGEVWIGDNRAHRYVSRSDPMLFHFRDFRRI